MATLSIHLFSTGTRIRYSGAAIVGFFEAAREASAHETTIDYTLRPDDVPFNISITGRVRQDVSQSRLTITLFASDPAATGDPTHIQAVVPVQFGPGSPGEARVSPQSRAPLLRRPSRSSS
jgi:hypothetical protein